MPHNKALEDASTQLQGDAFFDGPCHEVFIRFAYHDEAICVDMADDNWDQIEITKNGWRKIAGKDSPVKFMRTSVMLAIANSSQQGSIHDLSEFLNLESQTEFQLIVSSLIGAAQPNGPFPILLLQGNKAAPRAPQPNCFEASSTRRPSRSGPCPVLRGICSSGLANAG